MPAVLFLQALIAGTILPLQAGINAILAKSVGHSLAAALISFAVGTVALLSVVLVLRVPMPAPAKFAGLPWWVWLGGGALGAFFVASTTFLAPRLGAAVMLAAIVAGQMIASLALDHYGLVGYAPQAINLPRILGVGFLVVGVVLIRRF